MKSILSLSLFVLYSIAISAQTETRELDSFSGVSVSAGISIEYKSGEPKADITLKNVESDELIMKNKGETLVVKFKDSNFWNNKKNRKVKIVLYGDTPLNNVSVSSGASFRSNYLFETNECDIDVSSGGSLSLMVEAQEIDVNVSSGGSASLEGKADYLEVDVSSGGSFRGTELEAVKVDADASSGGGAKVWVTDHLSAGTSSGGGVKYKGDPKTTNINSSKWSGGSVKKI